MPTPKDKATLLAIRIPPELRNKFKAACATRGMSMSSVLQSVIAEYIENADPTAKKTPPKKTATPKEYQLSNPTPELITLVQDIAEMFRQEMQGAGLTARGLAERLGVSESRVWQLLDGRAISIRTISEVLNVLGKRAKIEAT